VDEDVVADARLDQRAGDARLGGQLALPVAREPLVDDRAHRRLVDRVALALDGVALVRHHVPDRGHGGDPDMPGRRRCRRRERHEGEHPGAGRDQLPHPTTIDPFMSGWIRQM
jgi:hypothetical protein